jgi:uncharacterized lipoprotein YbaY
LRLVWLAVSICKALVFGSSASNLTSNEAISTVFVVISSVWIAVSVCKAVVFSSSVFSLPCKAVISVSLEDIWVVWLAVSVCKAVVFSSSVFSLPCKAVISVSLDIIWVVWLAVSVCKAVVFDSSVFNLPCKAVISVSLEDIWVVWLAVSVSNYVNAVCNPSVLMILKSPSLIKSCFPSNSLYTFPIFGMEREVWIFTEPDTIKLFDIVPPELLIKYLASNLSKSTDEELLL